MNTGKYIFAQLIEFLPQRIFDRIVMKYEGNKYVKHFTCWNQLLVMMFGQLSNRDSLRDLTSIISAHSNKAYHLGFGKNVTRSNLAKVNERREPRIFEEFAYHMIDIARRKRIYKEFEIEGKVFAFDSTTIDLCLSVFWWAKFRRTKAGIKMHTLYEIQTDIPTFIHITEAKVPDQRAMCSLGPGPRVKLCQLIKGTGALPKLWRGGIQGGRELYLVVLIVCDHVCFTFVGLAL